MNKLTRLSIIVSFTMVIITFIISPLINLNVRSTKINAANKMYVNKLKLVEYTYILKNELLELKVQNNYGDDFGNLSNKVLDLESLINRLNVNILNNTLYIHDDVDLTPEDQKTYQILLTEYKKIQGNLNE